MNLANQTLIAMTVLALAGCASVSELRDHSPQSIFQGDKPVSAVTQCISDAWSSKRVQISVIPTRNGESVQLLSLSGAPVAFVDVENDKGVTRASYYTQAGKGAWFGGRVEKCM